MNTKSAGSLILNIVPITLNKQSILVGHVPYIAKEQYRQLRDSYWRTHAFRYDSYTGQIFNVAIAPDAAPIGEQQEAEVQDHLGLVARGIQQSVLVWLADSKTPIIRSGKELIFWGQTNQALLLSRTVKEAGLTIISGLEVAVKYELDCRIFRSIDGTQYLCFVIDIATSNILDIPVSALLGKPIKLIGKYVERRQPSEHPYLKPHLELLGKISAVDGKRLKLTDTDNIDEIDAEKALLEPTVDNLYEILQAFYGNKAIPVIQKLRTSRESLATAQGKMERIRDTIKRLRNRKIIIANDVEVQVEEPLEPTSKYFPEYITTERPTLLVGAQGRSSCSVPDQGIMRHGPFMYMLHERNAPLIGVICESRYRGRVEQFMNLLVNGFADELWNNAQKQNPFPTGLIGKFRLSKVELDYEECQDADAISYRTAVRRLLERTHRLPDLALVQIQHEFRQLPQASNPYFVTKAAFMGAGVPIQEVKIENIELRGESLAYLLNNLALATYAKLDGTPWVIATHRPTTHELVIGLSSTEVTRQRLGERKRYVGITTVFQGDGRYLVWDVTREVEYAEYAEALLQSLRTAVRYVYAQNAWQEGDKIRLVCHVYKRLKDREVESIKALVHELIDGKFIVEFAFLDVSEEHPFHLFDLSQKGMTYRSSGKMLVKGTGLPDRGICLQLDGSRGLLHLTGPRDVKTEQQGLPKPLLVELHPDSDFTDMTYLLRQIYHFTYMSWRSFFPATQPVTILYSQLIARLLGNLSLVAGWDSTVLSVGSLRGRRWFL